MLDVNSMAAQAYLSFLAETRAEFLATASEALGRELAVGYIYDVILNGLTVQLTPSEAARVATLPEVKHVEPAGATVAHRFAGRVGSAPRPRGARRMPALRAATAARALWSALWTRPELRSSLLCRRRWGWL